MVWEVPPRLEELCSADLAEALLSLSKHSNWTLGPRHLGVHNGSMLSSIITHDDYQSHCGKAWRSLSKTLPTLSEVQSGDPGHSDLPPSSGAPIALFFEFRF